MSQLSSALLHSEVRNEVVALKEQRLQEGEVMHDFASTKKAPYDYSLRADQDTSEAILCPAYIS
jgi:hypothetical protein